MYAVVEASRRRGGHGREEKVDKGEHTLASIAKGSGERAGNLS